MSSGSTQNRKRKSGSASHHDPSVPTSPRRAGALQPPPDDLFAAREELVKLFSPIPEMSLDQFLRELVPTVEEKVLYSAMEKLKSGVKLPKEKDTRSFLTSSDALSAYISKLPSSRKEKEALAFRDLELFLDALVEIAAEFNESPLFTHSTKQTHLSGEKANTSRPDSYFHLLALGLQDLLVGWEQLTVIAEFKKRKNWKAQSDNWAKILWGLHHILRNDPCRLAAFGFSIEDDDARLWYYARSDVFVSEPFNWIDNPKILVKFILGLTLLKTEHVSPVPPPASTSSTTANVTSTTIATPLPSFPDYTTNGACERPESSEGAPVDHPLSPMPSRPPVLYKADDQVDIAFGHPESSEDAPVDHPLGPVPPYIPTFDGPVPHDQVDIAFGCPESSEGAPEDQVDRLEAPTATTGLKNDSPTPDLESLYQHPEFLERIGIDPTMKRISVDGQIRYEIQVESDFFITEKILCDFKADRGIGRGTRVSVVYAKGAEHSTAPRYVLKDVWLEDEAQPEGDKLKELETLVKEDSEDHGVDIKGWFNKHLLQMHAHQTLSHRVPGSIGIRKFLSLTEDDATRKAPVRQKTHTGSQRTSSQGGPSPHPSQGARARRTNPGRFHYRIVTKGELQPLEKVECREQAAYVVLGVFRACRVLWTYKRVHRDISAWNVYWDPVSKTGRLGDFDYTYEYDTLSTGTTKTGTPQFWSLEVEQGEFLLLRGVPKSPPVFKHNPLHDLESLFWVSLWAHLFLVDEEDLGEHKCVPTERQDFYRAFFPATATEVSSVRSKIILGGQWPRLRLANAHLATIVNPLVRDVIMSHVSSFATEVVNQYQIAEASLLDSVTINANNPAFANAFATINKMVLEIGCKLVEQEGEAPTTEETEKPIPMKLKVRPLWKYSYVLKLGRPDDTPRWPDPEEEDGGEDAAEDAEQRGRKRAKTDDTSGVQM